MLTTNLSTPEGKLALGYEAGRRTVLWFSATLGAVLGVFLILLLPTYFFVTFAEHETARELELAKEQDRGARTDQTETAIAELNSAAARILNEEESKPALYPTLADILRRLPPSITLSSIDLRANNHELTLVGLADTRDHFLQMLELLRQSPHVSAVNSPITNIIRERNVNFSITLALTP